MPYRQFVPRFTPPFRVADVQVVPISNLEKIRQHNDETFSFSAKE